MQENYWWELQLQLEFVAVGKWELLPPADPLRLPYRLIFQVVFVCVYSPQVWDYELERSAEHWAHTCRWEHGPSHMLTQIGQNLGAHWGRYVCEAK